MQSIAAIDQLRRYANPLARLAHTALEQKSHAKLSSGLLQLYRLALVGEDRVPAHDGQSGDLGQVSYDVFGDAVREILLLGIAAHVVEREHSDRRLRSSGRARLSRRANRLGG